MARRPPRCWRAVAAYGALVANQPTQIVDGAGRRIGEMRNCGGAAGCGRRACLLCRRAACLRWGGCLGGSNLPSQSPRPYGKARVGLRVAFGTGSAPRRL